MIKNENGRSMVEMLGVLAIIGVLSVAGIAGYTMAMNKYRSNEILNVASQAVVLAQTYNAGNGITEETPAADLGLTGVPSYVTALSVEKSGNSWQVNVTDTSGACETAKDNAGSSFTITCEEAAAAAEQAGG